MKNNNDVSSLVVVGRVLLSCAAVAALVLQLLTWDDAARPAADRHTRFTCPMHPQVVSPAPGDCPICRMALEPVKRAPPSPAPSARVEPELPMPSGAGLERFDAIARIKRFPIALEMRAAAWLE